ncbi:hypothetical protein P152DRAFT_393484 [Eremomyces bilateralis CBS 781.70]|uniref:Uncharacterized protein n=1 Tax=Eremomyces bilateralis CBS 781.70 TaxID=1392243 RepID=A0A6G1G957_9PEZI|nr:uncharacterized protein P152DRAFT_393484 [Eremomyces bilateralis CBS 781.70]KAF1814618.1 hypothetical protein P152DRAFT_393484 [Eremomyces bilateralis CBS 781.70]
MSTPRLTYILSRYTPHLHPSLRPTNPPRNLDPIFAVGIGTAAVALRINRDEKAKGFATKDIVEMLRRRINLAVAQLGGKPGGS